ncbi:hypothetical protein [Polaromonas sp. CG_9.11]|uniref:hypothetical protein n=1 Tax=Polaromonas sp. CG_9.11 TaxID=2787730 RepID=UPI0018C9FC06|nr:hypothetical protein [Polaromonas sp. CG_9.11]MBG6077321.1 hypothetical protein [Polaromonas sp. CG_9.11]
MNSSPTQPTDAKPVDADLVEQAAPGHGVPSQDPNLAAQIALSPEEAERESKSTLVGGGLVAGSAAGAAVGAVVAGPVGVLVGGMVGAVAGAMGGAGVGSMGGAGAGEMEESEESTTNAEDAIKDAENTHHNIRPR